jgi:uncharacterized protein YycO
MRSRRYPPSQLDGTTVKHCAPGAKAELHDFQPGDFILSHGDTFICHFIRVGQSLAFWGRDRKYTWWSHAAMIVSPQGDLIEAVGGGVRRSHLSEYTATDYHMVQLNALASVHDRAQICRYAEWSLGQEYGLATNIIIIISVLTGSRLTFGFDGQSVCSGLVARALERGAAIFDRSPSHILPADLAKYFSVEPPAKGSSKGKLPRR